MNEQEITKVGFEETVEFLRELDGLVAYSPVFMHDNESADFTGWSVEQREEAARWAVDLAFYLTSFAESAEAGFPETFGVVVEENER